MSITDNSLAASAGLYQRQMTSYRRTRVAILEGAKTLVTLKGVSGCSMIEIADTSQVSRATLYNHFRDKSALFQALLESEVDRFLELASRETDAANALVILANEISTDKALATLRKVDSDVLTLLCSRSYHPLWLKIRNQVTVAAGSAEMGEMTVRWLIGQVFQPLEPSNIAIQAQSISDLARFKR